MIALGPEDSKHGAVETRPGAARCAELFRKNRDTIDGIIITLPNFGDERAIADTLRMSGLSVPILVQATPDRPGHMTIRDWRDRFCGKMSVCNNLKQYGFPYSLTTLHTEASDSDVFRCDLNRFAGVCGWSGNAGLPRRSHRRAPGCIQHRPLQRRTASPSNRLTFPKSSGASRV